MKRSRDKTEPLSFRLAPKIKQKLAWKAAERGQDMGEFLRALVSDAVKDAKPPVTSESWGIQASDAERRAWSDAAERYHVPVDDMARRVLNDFVYKTFGRQPRLRDGQYIWNKPADE